MIYCCCCCCCARHNLAVPVNSIDDAQWQKMSRAYLVCRKQKFHWHFIPAHNRVKIALFGSHFANEVNDRSSNHKESKQWKSRSETRECKISFFLRFVPVLRLAELRLLLLLTAPSSIRNKLSSLLDKSQVKNFPSLTLVGALNNNDWMFSLLAWIPHSLAHSLSLFTHSFASLYKWGSKYVCISLLRQLNLTSKSSENKE